MENTIPKKRKNQIHVTAKIWGNDNVFLLLPLLNKLDDFMKAHVQLDQYGSGVTFIGFLFVFEPSSRDFHPNFLEYNKGRKELILQYRLPYEEMLKASPVENFQTLVNYFLTALETYHHADRDTTLLNDVSDPIEHFDFTAWKKDVENWFEAEGWLMSAVA